MEKLIQRNNRFKILTPFGWSDFDGFSKQTKESFIKLTISTFEEIECTLDHRIFTSEGYIEAKNIKTDTKIVTKNGLFDIIDISIINGKKDFYDPLEVKLANQYYTENFINHNCEFLGSSGTLIAGWKLKQLVSKAPLIERDGLIQFIQPEENHVYMMVCDVSRGKGLDYSAFQCIDVTSMPYKQVCVFRNNAVTPIDYAEVIHRVAKAYNNASILTEINDIGEQVSNSLHYDFGYEHILFTENAGRSGKRISSGFGGGQVDKGIRTTKVVKSVGCSILKLLIEQDQLLINDHETINELSTFSKKNNSYEAESGKNDDLVMCLVLFGWLSEQQYFKDYTNINTLMSLRDKTEEDIEQDLAPFGFVVSAAHDEASIQEVWNESSNPDSWMFRPIETLDNF